MDRLRTMSVFVSVAEQSGFAAAARQLNMSPPSVTRAISGLENRLGARLFHRTTRSVTLTESGERYLADCRRILNEIEEADRQATGAHGAPRGAVTVTASVLFGRQVLTPVLLDMQAKYPEISVSSLFVDRIVHLVDEGVDVAIRIAELPDSSLSAVRVGAVGRSLCASPAYVAKHGMPESPRDLARHELIDFTHEAPHGEWAFRTPTGTRSVKVRSRLRFNVADAAIEAAEAGAGITRVRSYMIGPQLEAGTLVKLLEAYEPPAVPVQVVHKETGQTSARVRAVVDFLVAALRRDPSINKAASKQNPATQ